MTPYPSLTVAPGERLPARWPESQEPSIKPPIAGPNSHRKPVSETPRWVIRKTGADRT